MKLYKFRELKDKDQLKYIKEIAESGRFRCENFLKFNDMNEGVFTIDARNHHLKLEDKLVYRICSFSMKSALKSQLMWGHYANAGLGVAIEVEVDKSKIEYIKQVKYGPSKKELNTPEQILTHKSVDWAYENEYRYLSDNNLEEDENKCIRIGKITHVYFGTPYQGLRNYDEIEKKHENLGGYLVLKGKLETFLKAHNIPFSDYPFNLT